MGLAMKKVSLIAADQGSDRASVRQLSPLVTGARNWPCFPS